ncbi:MAG: 3-oxoacyl-ACP reductase FabG [Anaerolineae bacterium]|nr:3-oxoacyl-ACP reductase FabG [Anaerolineae bacterium]
MKLEGRVAIVTGASRGIGLATARLFAQEGAKVVLAARSRDDLEAAAADLRQGGAEALAVPTDVTKKEDTVRLAQVTQDHFGQIDVLVNNAGVTRHKLVLDITEEDWDLTFDVNIKGVFLCTQAVLPMMIARRSGRIINVASMSALRGSVRRSAYSAAKHAVIGFADSVAQEVGPYGISVNTIAPGPVATVLRARRYPLEDPALLPQPIEVARLALFLASDDARTIHGAVVRVAVGPEPIPVNESVTIDD